MVESLESRVLIGREPLPKIFKGGTLTIENLCQLMNFWLILLDGGCHIFIGKVVVQWIFSACQMDVKWKVKTTTLNQLLTNIHLTST